jgi:hypothetical protein
VYCIKCGTKNDKQAKYCYKCGTPLRTDLLIDKARVSPRRFSLVWQAIPQRFPQRKIGAIAGLIVFVFVLGFGILATIRMEEPSLSHPLLTPQAVPTDEGGEITSRGESTPHFMTEDDLERLALIASYFTNPRSREVITSEIKVTTLFTTPLDFDGKTITLTGKVLKKTLVLDVLPSGWPTSYYLIVGDETDSLPVLYRGDAKAIEVGDTVRVTGLFSKTGRGVNADAVRKLDPLISIIARPLYLFLTYLIATVLVLVFLAFSIRTFWRMRRQAKLKLVKAIQP